MVLGLALSYVSGYLGAEVVTLGAFVILIAVLMVRPTGLFTPARERQV
jgi:branched-chain amino acid transport system permease protein